MNDIKSQLIVKNSDDFVQNAFNLPNYVNHILKSKNESKSSQSKQKKIRSFN